MSTFITAALLCFLAALSVESAQPVAFAGLAFRGTVAEESLFFPYSSKVISPEWNQKAADVLRQRPPRHFKTILGLSDFDKGETLAVACVLDSETVAIEDSGDGFLLRISLGAEALFIDFKSRAVVSAFPFVLTVSDYLDHRPEINEVAERIRLITDNTDERPSLLNHFADVIGEARPKARVGGILQVRHVDLEEKALKFLPEAYSRDTRQLKFWLAQQFGAELAKHHGVAVLPYSQDAAMGQMALRFKSRADIINLKIPEPSYSLDLTLRGFSKTVAKETASEVAWVYGAYFTIRFYQQLLNKAYLHEESKHGYTRVVPKSKVSMNDWLGFERSLMDFCANYAISFGNGKNQREVKEALQKCMY
ncbi:MAG TPA: hypothetical protein P5186_03875 [Candidatus Paceibacterota bacterium]|nr:hypothetical protein [Verrucomicrobiota bacterium]HRY47166.1 hypothetical protein [Candidatus Paceibacterota bacterium]HRZ99703.1 hypothetical protein [Candidatus Paceibacterota bacterium]